METCLPPHVIQTRVNTVFSAKAVEKGGVVRRSARWVETEIGRQRFEAEVRARGFHLVECGSQLLVICNQSGLRVIC